MADGLLATTFRFRVTLSPSPAPGAASPAAGQPLGDGAFQECSGLDLEMDVAEYIEGGRTNGVIQRAGRVKVSRIVLKRGMLHPHEGGGVSTELWRWFQDVVDGVRPIRRYDGTVEMLGAQERVVGTWTFSRGLPAKIVGPALNAKTGDIAIEELQIAHEGLRMAVA
jgi:phage tail-like protein